MYLIYFLHKTKQQLSNDWHVRSHKKVRFSCIRPGSPNHDSAVKSPWSLLSLTRSETNLSQNQPTFCDATTGLPAKWRKNQRRCMEMSAVSDDRELKQLRRRPQRQLQKNNRFNDQNNSSARASHFLVHFFDVHCTTTTWNLPICVLRRTWTYNDEFSFLFSNLNKVLKNSNPGKVACFWHIERIQIDAIKFERAQIRSFFYQLFHCHRRRPCLRSLITDKQKWPL